MAFAVFLIILFFQNVSDKFVFIGMVLIATIIPDLDTGYSSFGRHAIFAPLQFFVKHRGIIHSFTTGVLLSVLVAIWWPVASLGFFLGYSVHIMIDSFTKDGVQPFWPFSWKSRGPIVSGGRIEESLFLTMIFVDFMLFFVLIVLG